MRCSKVYYGRSSKCMVCFSTWPAAGAVSSVYIRERSPSALAPLTCYIDNPPRAALRRIERPLRFPRQNLYTRLHDWCHTEARPKGEPGLIRPKLEPHRHVRSPSYEKMAKVRWTKHTSSKLLQLLFVHSSRRIFCKNEKAPYRTFACM